MGVENSKLFPLIQISDLKGYPVWEVILDDEADDPSMFPVAPLPVKDLLRRFVASRVRLANGSFAWAMLFNLDLTNARKTEQLLQLRIERNGEWFWLARYWDVDYQRSGPEALANFLGLSVDEVFPISYDIGQIAVGDLSIISGSVPKEPRERLPEDEIIRMAVG